MYKVVYEMDKKLYSCCRNSDIVDYDMRVEYELNKWTYPKLSGSKLFVFDNLKSARDMVSENCWEYSHKIYQCKVKNPISIVGKKDESLYYDTYMIWKNYLEQKKKKKKIMWAFGIDIPLDTCLCSAVKLIGKPL